MSGTAAFRVETMHDLRGAEYSYQAFVMECDHGNDEYGGHGKLIEPVSSGLIEDEAFPIGVMVLAPLAVEWRRNGFPCRCKPPTLAAMRAVVNQQRKLAEVSG